jgi:hypothetical protein
MNKNFGAVVALSAVFLSACSQPAAETGSAPTASTTAQATPSVASTRATISTPTPKPTPKPTNVYLVDQPATHKGVQITIHSASLAESVSMNQTTYRAGTPYAKYTPLAPKAGAKFVSVKATVTNNAKSGMDLTCGYPIKIVVVNSKDQEYTPIEKLYNLQGNPECNDQLQPGFSAEMEWAFEVPANSEILGAAFWDVTDFSGLGGDPAIVAFLPSLK